MNTDQIVANAIAISIKKEFQKLEWWDEVQDEVKNRLEWIVDRIDSLGSYYCNIFMTFFRWEYECRKQEGKTVSNPMAGYIISLLGSRIPEEAYQCGVTPTRSILGIYDYIQPNDADVAACMFLCNKINLLEKSGLLPAKSIALKTSKEEIAQAFQDVFRKKSHTSLKIMEEKLKWKFDGNEEKAP